MQKLATEIKLSQISLKVAGWERLEGDVRTAQKEVQYVYEK